MLFKAVIFNPVYHPPLPHFFSHNIKALIKAIFCSLLIFCFTPPTQANSRTTPICEFEINAKTPAGDYLYEIEIKGKAKGIDDFSSYRAILTLSKPGSRAAMWEMDETVSPDARKFTMKTDEQVQKLKLKPGKELKFEFRNKGLVPTETYYASADIIPLVDGLKLDPICRWEGMVRIPEGEETTNIAEVQCFKAEITVAEKLTKTSSAKAKLVSGNVSISWRSTTESNIQAYLVERSSAEKFAKSRARTGKLAEVGKKAEQAKVASAEVLGNIAEKQKASAERVRNDEIIALNTSAKEKSVKSAAVRDSAEKVAVLGELTEKRSAVERKAVFTPIEGGEVAPTGAGPTYEVIDTSLFPGVYRLKAIFADKTELVLATSSLDEILKTQAKAIEQQLPIDCALDEAPKDAAEKAKLQ